MGVRRLTARVLPENEAAIGLFHTVFPVCLTGRDDDGVLLTALLDGTGAQITMDDILADLCG